MKVSFYGHTRQYHNIKEEIDGNIARVLESGSYVMGPMGSEFEAQASGYFGAKHAIGVGNGTDGMDETQMLIDNLPDAPVLFGSDLHKTEYGA